MKLNMTNHSISTRAAGILCGLMFLLTRTPTLGAQGGAELSLPAVNRTVPEHTPPVIGLALSGNSSEQELRHVRLFAEPLVPTGTVPSATENSQLAEALNQHVQRTVDDDFSALEQFVTSHPGSPWTPAVLFNLGMEYYKTGRYTKVLDAWAKAWPLLQPATDPAPKALADRAVSELAMMYCKMGRMGELSRLLDSIKGRVITGSSAQRTSSARETMWAMQHWPEKAYRCGPVALDRIRASGKQLSTGDLLVYNARATTNGYSLAQLGRLSRDLGLNYQMAAREAGAALVIPAVINMKVGHYAALTREENGRYLLEDPTFGNAWISRQVLEEEGSGYFLIPSGGDLPTRWRAVNEAEGGTIFGKGPVQGLDDHGPGPNGPNCGGSGQPCCHGPSPGAGPASGGDGGDCGMPVFALSTLEVSLIIQDCPLGYNPPIGPHVRFVPTYNQREANQPANFSYSNLGQQWSFDYVAYISDNPNVPSADVNYYTDGGGMLTFTGFNKNTQTFAAQTMSQATLTRTSLNSYQMVFQDGSMYVFAQPTATNGTSRNVFLTAVVDPRGNSIQISYDSNFRIVTLTDAIGQASTFSYLGG